MAAYVQPQMADELENQERTGAAQQGLSFDQFSRFTAEVREEPLWRRESDRYVDYYDGNQLTPDQLAELENRQMGPLITNLIAPTINTVLGMEAKTRTDWRVVPSGNDNASSDVADALNEKLHEAERETRADRAISDAYAGAIKAGLGWVEVGRTLNPFKPTPYMVNSLHRREMFWQWTAKEPDLDDSTYLIRRRWYHKDTLKAYFPQMADLIEAASGAWPNELFINRWQERPELLKSFDQERGWAWEDYEWRDIGRSRVCLFEVLYKVVVRGYVLKLPNRTVEFNKNNPVHVAAMSAGIRPRPAIYNRLNRSLWMGPHKLTDKPHTSHRYPYVPFWGYREDLTGIPYGAIRAMISPQDEINARRQKLMWLLSAKRLMIDSDAYDTRMNTLSDILDSLNRADQAIVLNPERKNKDAVQIDNNVELSERQYQIMIESKESLRQAAGVYQPFFDQANNSESGVAVQTLMDLGTTTLAEINDNHRFARQIVGELLLEEIRRDVAGQSVQVIVGEEPDQRIISLNQPTKDELTGAPMHVNDTERTPVKIAIDDVPNSTTYRQQQFKLLSETMKGLPEQLQALIAPFWMELSDMPKRREVAMLLRRAVGIGDEQQEITPEQVEQIVQQALQQAGVEQKNRELDIKEREVTIKEHDSDMSRTAQTEKDLAKAESERANTNREDTRLGIELAERVNALGQQVEGLQETAKQEQAQKQTEAKTEKIEKEHTKMGAEHSALTKQVNDLSRAVDRLSKEVMRKDQADPAVKEMAKKLDSMQRDMLRVMMDKTKAPAKQEQAQPTVVFEQGAIQVTTGTPSKKMTVKGPSGQTYTGEIEVSDK